MQLVQPGAISTGTVCVQSSAGHNVKFLRGAQPDATARMLVEDEKS